VQNRRINGVFLGIKCRHPPAICHHPTVQFFIRQLGQRHLHHLRRGRRPFHLNTLHLELVNNGRPDLADLFLRVLTGNSIIHKTADLLLDKIPVIQLGEFRDAFGTH